MLNRKLHPEDWQVFFDDLSNEFHQDSIQRYVLLSVSTPELVGLRDVAPWLEFEQISYDQETDSLHLLLDGFNHRIYNPVTIWAAVKADGNVERLVVIRRDGSKDYIAFSKYRSPHSAAIFNVRPENLGLFRSSSPENNTRLRKSWDCFLHPTDG